MQELCKDCVKSSTFSAKQLARLRSRDYRLAKLEEVDFETIANYKPSEPEGWFEKVIASILTEGILQPVLIVKNLEGLELVDGNHRAWTAWKYDLECPVRIFSPICGKCTETMFRENAMSHTISIGWQY